MITKSPQRLGKRPAPSARTSTPLARYRLGRAALDLVTFTISELAHLTQLPTNTVYSFVSELGPERMRSESFGSPAPGRPRKRYSLTDEGIGYLLEQNLAVAKVLREQHGGEPAKTGTGVFRIGPDVYIRGEVSCGRDVVIEGRVDGKIDLGQHDVLIRRNGRVYADVIGRVVTVEGKVEGNILAQERAILRPTGTVQGDVISPEVVREKGTRLIGSVRSKTEAAPLDSAAEEELSFEVGGKPKVFIPSQSEATKE